MPQDLKDYLPDLDTLLDQVDRDKAEQKRRHATRPSDSAETATTAAKTPSVRPKPPSTAAAAAAGTEKARPRRRTLAGLTWKTALLPVAAVVVPLVLLYLAMNDRTRVVVVTVPSGSPVVTPAPSGTAVANRSAAPEASGFAAADASTSPDVEASAPGAAVAPSVEASAPAASAVPSASTATSAAPTPTPPPAPLPPKPKAPAKDVKKEVPPAPTSEPAPKPTAPPTSSISPKFVPLDD